MDLQTLRYVAACQTCSNTSNKNIHKSAKSTLSVELIEHDPLLAAQVAARFIDAANAVFESKIPPGQCSVEADPISGGRGDIVIQSMISNFHSPFRTTKQQHLYTVSPSRWRLQKLQLGSVDARLRWNGAQVRSHFKSQDS